MIKQQLIQWVPEHSTTEDGVERRVGVELEFTDLEPEVIANAIEDLFGGRSKMHSKVDWRVEGTQFGDFEIELDWAYFKTVVAKQESMDLGDFSELSNMVVEWLTQAAEQLIPWEIVTPPIAMSQLSELSKLVARLRDLGALGTRHSPQYAFGMHLNPELPNLQAGTILNYLKAYLCLYDWIAAEEKTDITRRVSNYIKHFDHHYIKMVIAPGYTPGLTALINDYLEYNPTRNRSLDLLPLFAFCDEKRVKNQVKDPRIKGRPTLHYRLPNCDIDNPQWNINSTWRLWLEVEKLANNPKRLGVFCDEFRQELSRVGYLFDSRWENRIRELLNDSSIEDEFIGQ